MAHRILQYDPWLQPFAGDIALRMKNYRDTKRRLLQPGQTLNDFANGYLYFGFHKTPEGWYYREWAPAADAIYLTGDFNNWNRRSHPLKKLENGVFELFLPGTDALWQDCTVLTVVISRGQELERIPLYATRVVQDPKTLAWNAQVQDLPPFPWGDAGFRPAGTPYIYECHIGMAQENGGVGTYEEFRCNVLPRVKSLGYNTLQIMAIMEHPYYASFGYQVTNFFAASSRFGPAEELKKLINEAHRLGIAVLLDVVHSHACKNTREGINEFDGTTCQFFHEGPRGDHSAWGTKCFDYGKPEVVHFLLSNLKYWLTEYHFDGFRFDGVTSMLYLNHGLGVSFDSYEKYFSMNTDTQAVTYLQLATELTRQVCPHAILVAEDMSGMPGMALPISAGGIGFDYRLAMGEPDMWIRLTKEVPDEHWDLHQIYHELTQRRPREKVIGYCESHDQALVGDKTLIFRMCDQAMYWDMAKDRENPVIDRGIALHKILRLLTFSLGGEGYLNFMGNEFGHPEWIDFPREGNGWSYHYCRRQWHLAEDPSLKYQYLQAFDRALLRLGKHLRSRRNGPELLCLDNHRKFLAYEKNGYLFICNLHPTQDAPEVFLPVSRPGGVYKFVLSTDDLEYGGYFHGWYTDRVVCERQGQQGIIVHLPHRTASVWKWKEK